MCYIGCLFLLTGKYRHGATLLSLDPVLAPYTSKYDEYFNTLIVGEFKIPKMSVIDVLLDGRVLLGNNLAIFNPDSNRINYIFNTVESYEVTLLKDDHVLLIFDTKIKIWNIQTQELEFTIKTEVSDTLVSDNILIIMFDGEDDLTAWNLDTYEQLSYISFYEEYDHIGFISHDIIGITFGEEISIWNIYTHKYKALKALNYDGGSKYFLNNGNIIISHKNDIQFWKYTNDLKLIHTIRHKNMDVLSDNLLLIDKKYIWDIDLMQIRITIPSLHNVQQCIYLPGDKLVIIYTDYIDILNLKYKTVEYTLPNINYSVQFTHGRLIISNTDKIVIMY